MRFLEKNKVIVGIVVVVLLCLVAAVGFQFFHKEEEKPNIPKDPVVLPSEDEWEISNSSSYSVDELWNIVNDIRSKLRKLFYESEVYRIHDIDSEHYTEEDNNKYVVFDLKFLEQLHQIVTDEVYSSFYTKMQLIKENYYMALQEDFSFVYFESAIAESRVDVSEVRLMSASDEYINSSVILTICENEENEECKLTVQVPFELKKVEGAWKVNQFRQ